MEVCTQNRVVHNGVDGTHSLKDEIEYVDAISEALIRIQQCVSRVICPNDNTLCTRSCSCESAL